MKAVVLEVKNGKAAVLKKNGDIIRIKQNELQAGDTIDIVGTTRGTGAGPIAAEILKRLVAAAFMVVVLTFVVWYTYNAAFAVSYVSVDVHPSLEFSLNRFNRVIKVYSVNDEAITLEKELETKHLIGNTLGQALKKTVDVMEEQGLFADSKNNATSGTGKGDTAGKEATKDKISGNGKNTSTACILLNVSGSEPERTGLLVDEIKESLNEISGMTNVTTNSDSSGTGSSYYLINTADLTEHNMASNLSISTGRYQAIRTVEARNSVRPSDKTDTAAVEKRASEIQIDKSLAERYKEASVEDLMKGVGAVKGTYKAPELKKDDGKVSISNLDIQYETHESVESFDPETVPEMYDVNGNLITGDWAEMETLPEQSFGEDPIEAAAEINEAYNADSEGNDVPAGSAGNENAYEFGPSRGDTSVTVPETTVDQGTISPGPQVPVGPWMQIPY